MLSHYFKIIFRGILCNRSYTIINIVGLATGMSVFFLIMLYVSYEYSVDEYHEHKDHIYQIARQDKNNFFLGDNRYAVTMAPLGPALIEEFSEVKSAARIVSEFNVQVNIKGEKYLESIVYGIDPEAFNLFSFEYLYGTPNTCLEDKFSAVISESVAAKYFHETNPIGKSFRFQDGQEFKVGGVIKDMPVNSHFRMEIMVPFETFLEINNKKHDLNNWGNNNYFTYVQLAEGSNPEDLEVKLHALLKRNNVGINTNGTSNTRLYLQKFTKIHLYSDFHFDIAPPTNVKNLYILSTIAILVLLIACINYTNLATSRTATRAMEVGIRKVGGASRKDLILQFLGESIFLTFLALPFSLILILLVFHQFEQFVEVDLSTHLTHYPEVLMMPVLICIIIGLISGSYPAFAVSNFKPITVLKGRIVKSVGRSNFRNILVITQFAVSGSFIIFVFIIMQQLNYIQNLDLGYNRERIITLKLEDQDIMDKMPVFKRELRKIPGVLNVASSSNLPNGNSGSNTVRWPGKSEEINWQILTGSVDFSFIDLYEIDIVAGRNFSREAGDENGAILINETAAKALGWENPIDRELSDWRDTCRIVGVMKDYHQHTLYKKIMPLQLFFNDFEWIVSIKVSGDNLKHTLEEIKNTKESFSDKYPFTYSFFDDEFDKVYKQEQKTGELVTWFAIITIILACLGLYGLAAFTTKQRVKEVGIRKVHGAPVYRLIYMLSKDFSILVLISFLISVPFNYYLLQKWLNDFAYHVEIKPLTFLIGLSIMLGLAWLTVGYKTCKLANSNPIDSLKDE